VLATPTAEGTLNATPQPIDLSLMETWGTATAVYEQTAVAMGLITPAPTSESSLPSLTPSVPPGGVATDTPIPGTTPLPVIVVATPTPGRPATYTLQPGEFPYCIARRFNVDPADLLSLNGLGAGQNYPSGTTLSIPQTGSYPGTRALQTHPTQYTVAVNDTFYKIACAFGDVDPAAIAAANGLAISAPLTTGQILNIP
jgi:LysM repeat protein